MSNGLVSNCLQKEKESLTFKMNARGGFLEFIQQFSCALARKGNSECPLRMKIVLSYFIRASAKSALHSRFDSVVMCQQKNTCTFELIMSVDNLPRIKLQQRRL